jgi:fluoride exporter
MARYWCSGMAARLLGETFPWGTLFVNIAGSFVIGFFATMTGPDGRILVGSTARLFVMIGFCGGYTTFSSLSLQTLNLMHDGEWIYAGLNGLSPWISSKNQWSPSLEGDGRCDRAGLAKSRSSRS